MTCMHILVLASQSPRRKELLERAGFQFQTLPVEVSEILEKNLNLKDALMALARRKADAAVVSDKTLKSKDILVLAADTVVVIDSEVLGKPKDFGQAVEYLHKLSGKRHSVITAICLKDLKTGQVVTSSCETFVQFRSLSENEIQEYVQTGEPMDKAGAYAIQGKAKIFVASIDGPLDNVIGLPVDLFKQLLEKHDWSISRQ